MPDAGRALLHHIFCYFVANFGKASVVAVRGGKLRCSAAGEAPALLTATYCMITL